MLRRITNRHRSLREADVLRLNAALITSRMLYHLPYQNLKKSQLKRIKVLLIKAHKIALGVLTYTSTKALQGTGTTNYLVELLNAHKINQLQRLRSTTQGISIIHNLGYDTSQMRKARTAN